MQLHQTDTAKAHMVDNRNLTSRIFDENTDNLEIISVDRLTAPAPSGSGALSDGSYYGRSAHRDAFLLAMLLSRSSCANGPAASRQRSLQRRPPLRLQQHTHRQHRAPLRAVAMFTGIVQGMATVQTVASKPNFATVGIRFPQGKLAGITIGASVAINGTCLTVTGIDGDSLHFDIMVRAAAGLGVCMLTRCAHACALPCAHHHDAVCCRIACMPWVPRMHHGTDACMLG